MEPNPLVWSAKVTERNYQTKFTYICNINSREFTFQQNLEKKIQVVSFKLCYLTQFSLPYQEEKIIWPHPLNFVASLSIRDSFYQTKINFETYFTSFLFKVTWIISVLFDLLVSASRGLVLHSYVVLFIAIPFTNIRIRTFLIRRFFWISKSITVLKTTLCSGLIRPKEVS